MLPWCFCIGDDFDRLDRDPSLIHNVENRDLSFDSSSSGSQEFGRTHVVMPNGRHEATIVWLHGLDEDSYIWAQILGSFRTHNIKWICPTAPTRPISVFAGYPGAAWFDPNISDDDTHADIEGLNASAEHVALLFSREPPDVKLGIGGFSIGAAAALYMTAYYILGESPTKVHNLSSIIVLSGWLPSHEMLKRLMDESFISSVVKEKSLPVFMCHGAEDDVVSYEHGERCGNILHNTGFIDLTFWKMDGLCHETCAAKILEMCSWLNDNIGLRGC